MTKLKVFRLVIAIENDFNTWLDEMNKDRKMQVRIHQVVTGTDNMYVFYDVYQNIEMPEVVLGRKNPNIQTEWLQLDFTTAEFLYFLLVNEVKFMEIAMKKPLEDRQAIFDFLGYDNARALKKSEGIEIANKVKEVLNMIHDHYSIGEHWEIDL